MGLFFGLIGKIFPLYLMIALGYISSRFLHVARESVAPLLIYIISPVVVFAATLKVEINASVMVLPWFMFGVSSALCLLFFAVGKYLWDDASRNIFAFSAGTGNTGYFGIPLAIILFEPSVANLFIFSMLASLLYESTIGFYIIARGSYTLRESVKKVLRLPSLYALHLGLVCNLMGWEFNASVMQFMEYFKGAFAILGMMMIGMGLKGIKEVGIDGKFIGMTFFTKFIFWPIVIFALIFLDREYIQFFSEDIYKAMFIFAVVPLAANAVSMAVLLNAAPEKASLAVLLSTLFSLVSIPLMVAFFL